MTERRRVLSPKAAVVVEGRIGQVLRAVETQTDTYVVLFDNGETEWFHISMLDDPPNGDER